MTKRRTDSHPRDLHARRPIDQTAAKVLAPSSDPYLPAKEFGTEPCSAVPLPYRLPYRDEPQLVGLRFGGFAVLGVSVTRSAKGPRWVVRCRCGNYSLRSHRAVNNPKNLSDCCHLCRHTNFLRRRAAGEGPPR